MTVGAIAVVDTGRHHPGVLARMGGQRCAAGAVVAVGHRQERLLDTLVRRVEAVDHVGPLQSGRYLRKGSLMPESVLMRQDLVQVWPIPTTRGRLDEWGHPTVDQRDCHVAQVGNEEGRRLVNGFRHSVDQNDNVPVVNPTSPQLVQDLDYRSYRPIQTRV
jgi:hypothetical protein